MAITYQIGNKLYLNLTNRCSNDCEFCVRRNSEGVAGYKLWLDEEPDYQEVIDQIGDPSRYKEIIFVGFGEPLYKLELVKKVARWLKERDAIVRVDTNGHANLIHGRNVVPELEGLIDNISISLNAATAEKYDQLCHSVYGKKAYDAMLNFAKEAKKYIPKVILSIVAYDDVDIEKAGQIAEELGVEFRVREYQD